MLKRWAAGSLMKEITSLVTEGFLGSGFRVYRLIEGAPPPDSMTDAGARSARFPISEHTPVYFNVIWAYSNSTVLIRVFMLSEAL